jgi:DnaK suppressor protein
MTIDLEHFKNKLITLKKDVQKNIEILKEKSQPVAPECSLGRLTRQEAMQEQNVALSNLRDYELKLKRIESALLRVESGSFGDCLDCGEEIAMGRLEIMPESIFCIHCASKKR